MGRKLQEAPISGRTARKVLRPGIYWRAVDEAVHLGYRRTTSGGRWVVRWRVSESYRQEPLGVADDVLEADGAEILTYAQALAAARALVERRRAEARVEAAGPLVTVRSSVEAYIAMRQARAGGASTRGDARSRLGKHVLGSAIAEIPLHELTERALRQWREGLPATFAPATRQRLVNDLRAALNASAREGREHLPERLPAVIKHAFASEEARSPEAREAQILDDEDVRRIVAAALEVDTAGGWEGDLHRLVLALAATGARFSQLARATCAGLQPAQQRLLVPVSSKGRGTKAAKVTAIPLGADAIATLRPVTAGRRGADPLLERWRHRQIGPARWERTSRGPWLAASELSRPWRLILEAAGLPIDLVPYALRHSSIVRGLRAGLPVRLVAALHDTSSAMIERHYAAFIADALSEIAARAVISLSPEEATVIPLRQR